VNKSRCDFKRVLIIATRQIGDVLCTTPLMHRARELWPDAVIDVLGYEKTMGMLAGNPDINEVIESPEHPKWREYKLLIKQIFRKYDLAIVTQPSDRAHIYGLLAAGQRVGIIPADLKHNWWKRLLSLYSVKLDYWNQHVVVERLRLLQPFETEQGAAHRLNPISVIPPFAAALPSDIDEFLNSGPTVVIHATPMWRFKRWPISCWAELIADLIRRHKNVVLTGSQSQQDQDLNAEIVATLRARLPTTSLTQVRDCAGRLSLGQTTSLLKRADFYVGVDTSVTHLAAACGTRVIALYGATAPPNFGPWPTNTIFDKERRSIWLLQGAEQSACVRFQRRGNVTIAQGPGDCVPCRKAGCLDKFESHSDCLDRLPVEAVSALLPDAP
jgi:heptosyltransferase-3